MDRNEIHNLADKIAQVIAAESKAVDFASIQTSLDAISDRLDRLEASPSTVKFNSHVAGPIHPSQDHFAVAEAIVDGLFARQEKACTFEPSKPCDHCSMCSSRGF